MSPRLQATPIEVAGERGFAYEELDAETREQLEVWVKSGDVPGGEVIKPGAVFRWRDLLVKFSPPKASLRDRFRPNAAIRSVRAYERIAPIRSPRPVLAMAGSSGLLVTEFIEGDFVERIWESEPHSMDQLVEFLAEMHERRVFHGDFHAHNMIWDGEAWYLIDLESLRHPLRTLVRRSMIEDHWARLHFCLALSPKLEAYFGRYLEISGLGWEPASAWKRVTRRSQAMSEAWPLVEM